MQKEIGDSIALYSFIMAVRICLVGVESELECGPCGA
jgi:hypothetical protein